MPAVLVNWSLLQFQTLVLILMRVSPILFMMPILSSNSLPGLLKAGLALTCGLILLPLVKIDPQVLPREPLQFGALMIAELMIGFILSLSIKIIFAAIQMGGELVAFQMGFSMASVVDPQSEVSTPVISQFIYFLGILIFLSLDAHHWFFRAVYQSFLVLAPGEIHLKAGLYSHLLNLMGNLFVIAVKLAAPVLAVLMFTQIALGILAKAVPQVNILMTSFCLTIGIGLLFLAFSVELLLPYFGSLFQAAGKGLVSTLLPLMQR
jgi:flagellar biosynthesis protein FliR